MRVVIGIVIGMGDAGGDCQLLVLARDFPGRERVGHGHTIVSNSGKTNYIHKEI